MTSDEKTQMLEAYGGAVKSHITRAARYADRLPEEHNLELIQTVRQELLGALSQLEDVERRALCKKE